MAQSTISIRMDPTLKAEFDTVCRDLGMSMSTAVVMLAKKMTREKRLPFEVSADPFYSEANQQRLRTAISQMEKKSDHNTDSYLSEKEIHYLEGILRDIETGKAHFEEHELIEEE